MSILQVMLLTLLNPTYLTISAGAVLLALLVLAASRNAQLTVAARVFLIYVHIALLLVPIAALSYTSGCALPGVQCTTRTLLFALPLILAGIITTTGVAGYYLLPRLYRRKLGARPMHDARMQTMVDRVAKKFGILPPAMFALDTAAPMAFSFSSFKPAIFVSIGMLDILSRKELEAVVLHELGHLCQRSSLLKFTSQLVRFVSPVAAFATRPHDIDAEERAADAFAIRLQKTSLHVGRARRNVEAFFQSA